MSAALQPINKVVAFEGVRKLLLSAEKRINAAIPKHLTAERMISVALTTLNQTPKILLCSPASIVGTVVQASELGLQLNGVLGEAYMVPFWNSRRQSFECQLQVGYRGLITLARRSGLVSVVRPELVFASDFLHIETGSDYKLSHTPDYDAPHRGQVNADGDIIDLRGAFAVVRFADGQGDFEYMPLTRLNELRSRSKARDRENREVGPWTTDPGEMYRKVPIRAIAKRLPLSVEFQHAAVLDEYGEAGVAQNLSAVIEGGANSTDILAELSQQRVSELADKYVTPRETAPATNAPRTTRRPR